MRILVLHNRYQRIGGEEAVVSNEVELLRRAGHDVQVEMVSNETIAGFASAVRAFRFAPYDPSRYAWAQRLVARHGPHVVHVHNFFPLLTPAVHEAAADSGCAVVQTLHNYRLLCAGALFLHDGKVCERCLSGSRCWGLLNRCYRRSAMGSLSLLRMQARAARHETWSRHVHRFIALSEFSRAKFIAGGLPAERIVVKPNFVTPNATPMVRKRSGALFVGRLSREKGVHILIEGWRSLSHIPLIVAGEGPERAWMEMHSPPNVRFVGHRTRQEIRDLMTVSMALVLPSTCYEAFPMTIVEALTCGLPVIASRLGAMDELVAEERTGLHFEPGNAVDLSAAVRRAFAAPERLAEMGRAAAALYAQLYTPERNLALLEDIYAEARRCSERRDTADWNSSNSIGALSRGDSVGGDTGMLRD